MTSNGLAQTSQELQIWRVQRKAAWHVLADCHTLGAPRQMVCPC